MPQPFGRIFVFPWLDRMSVTERVVALGWRLEDDANDSWTRRLERFKFSHYAGHDAAVRGACEVFPDALAECRFPWREVVLVSVLPSRETELPGTHPLAKLGPAIAERLGWRWAPGILTKPPHRPLHSLKGGMYERDAEVEGKYRAKRFKDDPDGVVVLDDLTTRGATINDAARAIQKANGEVPVWGLVLGKNEKKSWATTNGETIGNGHVPAEWARRWDAA